MCVQMHSDEHICAGQRIILCILIETQSLRYVLRKGFLLAWISPNRLGWLSGTVCLWPWNCKHRPPHLSPGWLQNVSPRMALYSGSSWDCKCVPPHLVYALLGTNPGPFPCRTSDLQPELHLWLHLFVFVYSCNQEGQKCLARAPAFSDLRQTASSASGHAPLSLPAAD